LVGVIALNGLGVYDGMVGGFGGLMGVIEGI
jgi:hypothetical protein